MAKKTKKKITKRETAILIQCIVDDQYGIDLAMYQSCELYDLISYLKKFIDLKVDTDDLKPAGDYLMGEISAIRRKYGK